MQLIIVGRVGWTFGQQHISHFPIDIQQNISIVKYEIVYYIRVLFEYNNASVLMLLNVLNEIYTFMTKRYRMLFNNILVVANSKF